MDRAAPHSQDEAMLAETVSFTDQQILIILLVLLGFLVVAVASFVLGCFWAWRAGRGSQSALVGWLLIGVLPFSCALLASIPGLADTIFLLAVFSLALASQVGLYVAAKRRSDARR